MRNTSFFSSAILKEMDEKPKTVKVQSVTKALAKARGQSNRYIKEYGELAWSAAILTAYQNGGYKELRYNYEKVPLKYMHMLIDAYKYKNTELELMIAQAASRPHMKKADSKKYLQGLADKLEGKS